MVTLCWAAKGGSGTTVVVSILALESSRPALLVDLAGDVPAVLGIAEPDRPGVVDWLAGDGSANQLIDLVVAVDDTTSLLPCRLTNGIRMRTDSGRVGDARWEQLVDWLNEWERRHQGDAWIDAGTGCPHPVVADLVPQRWLVTRACYLSLTRAARAPVQPTGVVLVAEAGRSLSAAEIESALAAKIVATVSQDPKVARSVDTGLLACRPPLTIRRTLRKATSP